MSAKETFPVVVITGPVGVGKTTTAGALSDLLKQHDMLHTMIDMDALRVTYPSPPDDRFNERLGHRNLADVTRNARVVGSTRLIASIESIHERIQTRDSAGSGSDAGVAWERDRAAELIAIMDAADVADVCIDTTGRGAGEVALEIGGCIGWLKET